MTDRLNSPAQRRKALQKALELIYDLAEERAVDQRGGNGCYCDLPGPGEDGVIECDGCAFRTIKLLAFEAVTLPEIVRRRKP